MIIRILMIAFAMAQVASAASAPPPPGTGNVGGSFAGSLPPPSALSTPAALPRNVAFALGAIQSIIILGAICLALMKSARPEHAGNVENATGPDPRDSTVGNPRRSRQRKTSMMLACGLLAIFLGGEALVRVLRPPSPVQIIRDHDLRLVGSSPIWGSSAEREHLACVRAHPERIRVMFLGGAISYGSALPDEQVFSALLEDRLNAARPDPGFCVMNFSQPFFSAQQKLAVASVEVPRYRPALVLWEGWNEFSTFSLLGGEAYEVRSFVLGSDGFPSLLGLPRPINRFMFTHSRLYEYLTLRYGERFPSTNEEAQATSQRLERLANVIDAAGAHLGVYQWPEFGRPFTDGSMDREVVMDHFVKGHHVPHYLLRQALLGQDEHALVTNSCCDFNAQGHRALAPVFERIVLDLLDNKSIPQ